MACHILAEGLPLAGNGKFPYLILARAIIAILHSAFFGTLSRESPSVRQYGLPYSCRGTPACGKRKAVQQQQRKAEKYGEVASNSMLKGIKNFKKHYNGINVFVDICNVFVYDIDVR